MSAVLLAPLIAMTAMAETLPPGTSGVEGKIMVSPSRPGPITRDDPAVAPASSTRFEVKAGDATVKTFITDADGRFQVALPPGRYVVAPEGPAPRIGRWRFEVEVVAGQLTKVEWVADSGMR